MKIHHTTEKTELGDCLVCGKPILMLWRDKAEKNGHSEQYQESKNGVTHFSCAGGKSLHELNEIRKCQSIVEKVPFATPTYLALKTGCSISFILDNRKEIGV